MTEKFKRVVWFGTLLFAVFMGVLAVLLNRSAPAPADQEILGISIGHWNSNGEQAYISGRRLTCQPASEAEAPYQEVCTLDVQGETLTVWASRNDRNSNMIFGGRCEATYGDEQLKCDIGSRHVHVHWFAFLDKPTALDSADLAQLQWQYLFENLPETFFVSLIWGIGGITAVLAVANLFTLLWHRIENRVFLSIVGGVPVAIVFFYAGMFGTIWLTGPFWD